MVYVSINMEVVDVFLRSGIGTDYKWRAFMEYSIWLDSLNLRVMEKRLGIDHFKWLMM